MNSKKKILIIQPIHPAGIKLLEGNSDYEFEIVDNCCSDITLDYLKRFSSLAKSWHMLSPVDDSIPIEDKHLKLNLSPFHPHI